MNTIITNAKIITMNSENDIAGSFSIKFGRVEKIWHSPLPPKEVLNSVKTEQILDMGGKALLPGFIDTHSHLLMYSLFKNQANCSSPLNQSISDILHQLKLKLKEISKNDWLLGWGYDNTLLKENRHPTRYELDQVSTEVPIMIRHTSVHFAVANTKALEIAGLHKGSKDPQGGHLGRDNESELNGVLYELPALDLVQAVIPNPSIEEMTKSIEVGAIDYLAEGITTCTDAGVGLDLGIAEYNAHIQAVKTLKNPMRMRYMILHHILNSEFRNKSATELNNDIMRETNNRAKLDSAKLFQDGSIQGFTASLREPYYTKPHEQGELLHQQKDFEKTLLNFHQRGFRLAIHGNGDRAISSILKGYEYVLSKSPKENHLHRIEHVQTATEDDLDQMKKLDVAASFFINHIYYWSDRHKKYFLGPERTSRLNPLKDATDRDILYTLHSDCPITPISPLFSVWAAVNRISMEQEIFGENQRISVKKAIETMTIDGARLNNDEQNSGSIEVGKYADFIILDNNPFEVDKMYIKNIKVLQTFISGEKVYQRK
ncbi:MULTISPECIES: amidohydrolase [unclassified Oceanobacillus]|uniref:amidohydrolase n=1 Tax=unclassified Oceanobacillus TaxID=2630292 RepID=UPI001BE5C0C9|nr:MULTISPECIES: amidohydrolase [unclassified Oceanobacillus]MBT2598911.1 amidohydrolase family protein [Oceanobacillus sp. ISL-74]MBT2651830.1 amidohydrolase family protein [Oceanobacillus sp. ISL-73]